MTYSPAALSGPHPLLQVRQEGEEEERRGAVGRRGAQRQCLLRLLLVTWPVHTPQDSLPWPSFLSQSWGSKPDCTSDSGDGPNLGRAPFSILLGLVHSCLI